MLVADLEQGQPQARLTSRKVALKKIVSGEVVSSEIIYSDIVSSSREEARLDRTPRRGLGGFSGQDHVRRRMAGHHGPVLLETATCKGRLGELVGTMRCAVNRNNTIQKRAHVSPSTLHFCVSKKSISSY